jgi:hypothetical protein
LAVTLDWEEAAGSLFFDPHAERIEIIRAEISNHRMFLNVFILIAPLMFCRCWNYLRF